MGLISHHPSPFTNLKSLKIYQADATELEITMSTEVKNYLLDSSQCATFTLVSYEEARAAMNVASARNLMRELQALLDQWKKNSEPKTKTTRVKKRKEPLKNHTETEHKQVEVDTNVKCHIERMTRIKERFKKGFKDTGHAISMLRKIEGVVTKLPASHWAKLQVSFNSLCAEAEASMGVMADRLKIQCDNK
ncbi:uncharacterized protein LOC143615237 [Bidens hawaiensis]|uniref:uncharacterized protein LOC143615237 n=1 Tax=Bidens hawaiensis TaxID=980011 RepID=UPI00404B4FE5